MPLIFSQIYSLYILGESGSEGAGEDVNEDPRLKCSYKELKRNKRGVCPVLRDFAHILDE
jgi:hypothetical protein